MNPASAQLKASYTYLPALDGLRAVSILLVLLAHAGLGRTLVPGGLGVLVFFVISGFLITRQMIVEIESSGTLNIANFYLRRVFRLMPALIVYVVLFGLILRYMGADIRLIHILSGLFYFANYYAIYIGFTADNHIPILWSLAVEEHYYILFPFCMLCFRHNLRGLVPWLAATVIGVLLWRLRQAFSCALPAVCNDGEHDAIFHATDTIFDCILYGAITALLLQYYTRVVRRIFLNTPAFLLAIAVLLFTLLYRDPLFRDTIRYSLQSISIAVLMVNVLFGGGLARRANRALSLKPALLVGRISYSLYLYHYGMLTVITMLQHTEQPEGLTGHTAYYTGAFALAALSYYGVERPMLALRKRRGKENRLAPILRTLSGA